MSTLRRSLAEWGLEIDERAFVSLLRESLGELAGSAEWGGADEELPLAEVALLREGAFTTTREALGANDPLLRGAVDSSALVASALSTREAATLLGVDPSRVRHRLTARPPTLYGMKWRAEWLLPRFQFAGKAEVPGLGEVVPHLDPSLSQVAVARGFVSPSPDLVVERGGKAGPPKAGSRKGEPQRAGRPDARGEPGRPLSPRAWLLAGNTPADVARLA